MNRLDKAKNNMDKVYGFDWGQRKEELQGELRGLDDERCYLASRCVASGNIWD